VCREHRGTTTTAERGLGLQEVRFPLCSVCTPHVPVASCVFGRCVNIVFCVQWRINLVSGCANMAVIHMQVLRLATVVCPDGKHRPTEEMNCRDS
jgi:hypothetical protein